MLLQLKQNAGTDAGGKIILAGDVGATKTNLALYKTEGDKMTSIREDKFPSHHYKNIIDLLGDFIKDESPDVICLGVAGPVLNGNAKLSNLDWDIKTDELSKQFPGKKIHIINDLEATAFGLAVLDEKDITIIHEGDKDATGNAAIIAPGTGLGEAGLLWDGVYHPFSTEGGHCDFAPRTDQDFELYQFLEKKFNHVSWERLLSGQGIINIYNFLRDELKREEPEWLREKLIDADQAAEISSHVTESALCKETMQLFITYLAYESSNLVLKVKATGGLFIGGGIPPQIVPMFKDFDFNSSFCASGRLSYLLEKVPVKIILNDKTALLGAGYFGAHG